jgi:hypothetical protein
MSIFTEENSYGIIESVSSILLFVLIGSSVSAVDDEVNFFITFGTANLDILSGYLAVNIAISIYVEFFYSGYFRH